MLDLVEIMTLEPRVGMLIAIALWASLYELLRSLPGLNKRHFAFISRSLAIVHSLLAVAMAFPLVVFMDGGMSIGTPNTTGQTLLIIISFGYYCFDVLSWLMHGYQRRKTDWCQICYSAAAVTSLSCALYTGRSAGDCTMGILLGELSNPFMYGRYLLWCLGLSEKPLARLNNFVFIITLTITVPIISPFLVEAIITTPSTCFLHKASSFLLLFLNMCYYVLFTKKYLVAASSHHTNTSPATTSTTTTTPSGSSTDIRRYTMMKSHSL